MKRKVKTVILSVIFTLAAGGIGAFITKDGMKLYDSLNKPPLSPPALTFPIVWTILYILMAVSFAFAYDAFRDRKKEQDKAVILYAVSLFMNILWPVIFFNYRAFLPALVWLIALLAVIIYMILLFYKGDKTGACLLIPYAVWVIFAAYLNTGTVILN